MKTPHHVLLAVVISCNNIIGLQAGKAMENIFQGCSVNLLTYYKMYIKNTTRNSN